MIKKMIRVLVSSVVLSGKNADEDTFLYTNDMSFGLPINETFFDGTRFLCTEHHNFQYHS